MLRWIILITLLITSETASAQSADAWLDQVLKLEQEGWGERANPALPDMARPITPLMAFVSFSMPEDSLKAILEQVERTGGITILRGLVNDSFKDTATLVATFSSNGSPGFSVDPKLFAKYAINAVPSFVVPNEESFDKISGNISLVAALETIVREGDNKDTARRLLDKLREFKP